MAETITIEIPIEAIDRTSSGVSSAISNLERLMRKQDEIGNRLSKLDRGLHIRADMDDSSILGKANEIENTVNALDGSEVSIVTNASDAASEIIDSVSDEAAELDGQDATVGIEADGQGLEVIDATSDALSALDGENAMVVASANDQATPILNSVGDAADALDGLDPSVNVNANDEASAVIDDVLAKAAEWGGSTWTGTLNAVNQMEQTGQNIASTATGAVAAGAAAMGVSAGVSQSMQTFVGFEQQMANVAAISGTTGAAFDSLTAKAQEMGATTKFTATEAAEAFTYMAMAGWGSGQMESGIEGIMNLAAASGESLGSVSDIVTDAMTAFGLSAEGFTSTGVANVTHFADVLAMASSRSNTNVGMLGESFKYVAPIAGAMGYSIEDTAIALGLMANSGIKASQAGTSLRTIMTSMTGPLEISGEAIGNVSIATQNADGTMRDFNDVLEDARYYWSQLSEAEQTSNAEAAFGKYAMSGWLAMMNSGADDVNKLTEAIYNADGASEQMKDIMLSTTQGSLDLMNSAIDAVQSNLGMRMSPYIKDIASAITEAMPSVDSAISSVMDKVDDFASSLKGNVAKMTSSQEWSEADLFGKVNIAWDTLIAQPFLDWVGGSGKAMFSNGLTTLVSEAGKIFTGGGGITSWLSAGLLAKGGLSLVSGFTGLANALSPVAGILKSIGTAATSAGSLGGFLSQVGGMIPMAGKIGLAAAGITAAVAGISAAIDSYNSAQISNSLEEHFGTISLSAQEAKQAATAILGADYLGNVERILEAGEEAQRARESAEQALQANEKLVWKASLQTEVEVEGDPAQTISDTVLQLVGAVQDTDGIKLGLKADLWLDAEGTDISGTVEDMISLVNTAIQSAGSTEVETLALKAAMEIEPEGDPSSIAQTLIDAAQEAVSLGQDADLGEISKQVAMEINPEGDVDSIAGTIQDFLQNAISQANSMDLEQISKDVAADITVNGGDNSALVGKIQEFFTELASGADAVTLEAIKKDIFVELTPEEQGSFDAALSKLAGEKAQGQILGPVERKIGITFTAEEAEAYQSNIDQYIDSKIQELEAETREAHISVQTFLDGAEGVTGDGSTLADNIKEWANLDAIEMNGLSETLTQAVETALQDGVMNVDEQSVISQLQSKIDAITGRWQQAQKQASMDWLSQEYGSLSGEQLTSGSATKVVEELQSLRDVAWQETESAAKSLYSVLNAAEGAGRITSEQNAAYHEQAGMAIRNQQSMDMMNSMDFISGTMMGTYGDKINENIGKTSSYMSDAIGTLSQWAETGNVGYLQSDLMNFGSQVSSGNGKGLFGITNDADQAAMASIWESFKPTADQYQSMMDEYVKMGQEIPSQVKQSFDQAMQIGAAAGDTDAAWQVYANALADSGDEVLKESISNMVEAGDLPEEFAAAWGRATQAVTDEPLTLSGLKAQAEDLDISVGDVDVAGKVAEALEGAGAGADEVTIGGDNALKLKYENIEIDDESAISGLADSLGTTMDKVMEYASEMEGGGIELNIPADDISIDASTGAVTFNGEGLEEAVQDQMEIGDISTEVPVDAEAVVEDVDTSGTDDIAATIEEAFSEIGPLDAEGPSVTVSLGDVDLQDSDVVAQITEKVEAIGGEIQGINAELGEVTIGVSSVDTGDAASQAQEQAEESLQDIQAEGTVNPTLTLGEADTETAYSDLTSQVQERMGDPIPADGTINVALTQTNDRDAAYAAMASEVQSTFDTPVPAKSTVNVTIDWHIVNPTASISVSGAGTGSGTVTASIAGNASGGVVDGKMLSWVGEEGREYIIPTVSGRRSRGIELWEQAGQDLGIIDSNGMINASTHARGGIVNRGYEETFGGGTRPWHGYGELAESDDDPWMNPFNRPDGYGDWADSYSDYSSTHEDYGEGDSETIRQYSYTGGFRPKRNSDFSTPYYAGEPVDEDEGYGTDARSGGGGSFGSGGDSSSRGSGNVTVNLGGVSVAPTINIDGKMNDSEIVEAVASQIKELINPIASEMADQIGKALENMPLY